MLIRIPVPPANRVAPSSKTVSLVLLKAGQRLTE